MDEGAGDHDAALLAGGHLADEFFSEMRGLHELKRGVGASAHLRRDVEVRPERGGGEESGDNGVDSTRDACALAGQMRFDDAQVLAELGDIPALATEQLNARFRRDDGIALAGNGLDERGFPAAIGAENGNMLSGCDAEADVVEHYGDRKSVV